MYVPSFQIQDNGIPILRRSDIEKIGEKLIEDFCPDAVKSPQPINIENFVEFYLKLKVDFQYLSNDGRYLGMTVFNNTDKVVVYDPERNEADYFHADAHTIIIDNRLLEENQEHRYRFTLGHESGHNILHSTYYSLNPNRFRALENNGKDSIVQCPLQPLLCVSKKTNSLWTDTDWMEWQANYLSSVLLMPKKAVENVVYSFERVKITSPYLLEQGISKIFNVSTEAARYRLRSLGLVKNRKRKT